MGFGTNGKLDMLIDVILLGGIFGGVALGLQKDYVFFIISIVFIILLIAFQIWKKRKRIEEEKERLRKQWGKDHDEKRDFEIINILYKFLKKNESTTFSIDNITWSDLNMDTVFHKVDHTKSLPGMQYLYYILRNTKFNNEILNKRNTIIQQLGERKDISQSMLYPLSLLGKRQGKNVFTYFKDGINVDTKYLPIYTILSYMPYIAILLLILYPSIATGFIVAILIINSTLYQRNKKNVYEEMEIFKYLGSLIKCGEGIVKIDKNTIDLNQDEIMAILKDTKQIRRNISKISFNEKFGSDAEVLVHYYNIIMLKEPKVFYKTTKLLNNNIENLFRLYQLVGEIDAYISVASYKDSLAYFTAPEFVDDKTSFQLEAEELYHPLLDNPISYTFNLDNKGALVTGSNASGKSTFLRTIGINCIFAQTINIVLAKNYKLSYFKILTSIGTMDDIVRGDSYFMAEAKSLKRIIDYLNPNQPILCILDEIFRGTNTAERISAATVALNYMIDRNTCVIAATHDLELTTLVNNKYNMYHFKETIEENDIKFDYLLREGATSTRNAIAILEYLDYPEEIYKEAQNKAKEYLKEK